MQAVNNIGQTGVLVLKIDEDDVNTVLLNTDVGSDGALQYAYDNFAAVFSENILEYAFAYAEIPRNQITKSKEKQPKVSSNFMRFISLGIILKTKFQKKTGNRHFCGGMRKEEYWEKLYCT